MIELIFLAGILFLLLRLAFRADQRHSDVWCAGYRAGIEAMRYDALVRKQHKETD